MSGKLIVIEGTDGSGKGTQTKLVADALQQQGHEVATLSFPTYGTDSCKDVEAYLRGELGQLGPKEAALLYAKNRKVEMAGVQEKLAAGTHFIINRYTASNAGHQGGKIADEKEREDFLEWLFHLEFEEFGIPEPDLTIVLHMPPFVGQQLVARKTEGREYLKGKARDIHEDDLNHLKNAEAAYLFAARKYGWTVIECTKDGVAEEVLTNPNVSPEEKVKTIPEIHEEVLKMVLSTLQT